MKLRSYLGLSILALSCHTMARADFTCMGTEQYRAACTVQNLFTRGNIDACLKKLCDQEMLRHAFALRGEMMNRINEIRRQMRLQPSPQPAQTAPQPEEKPSPAIQEAYDAYKKESTLENWGKLIAHVPQQDEDAAQAFVDPISLVFMQDPYRLKGTDFVFEHDIIMEWAAKSKSLGKPITNPLTNEPLDITRLEPDLDLKKTIETYVFEKLGITHLAGTKP